jgi:hypothetical protein
MSEKTRPTPVVDIVLKTLSDKDGKDKSLKLIQYTGKLILWAGSTRRLHAKFSQYGIGGPIKPLVTQLSMFRKIIRLGNWLKSLREIIKQGWTQTEIVDYIDLYTEIFDDIYLLVKIGVLAGNNPKRSKRWEHIADREASRGWFLSIIFNLYGELQKRKRVTDPQARRMSTISTVKLLCDGVFCGVDVFELEVDSMVQICSGLMSGMLSYYKIFRKLS